MHISIKFCLDFFITSRSIHVVLIGCQYIFVSFRILVNFVAFRILVYFISLRFPIFCFASLRFVIFRFDFVSQFSTTLAHRRLCRVKNMLAMYLKYHKAGLTSTTSVTSTANSSVKMVIGHKSLTNLRNEMIFLQGKPVFYIFLPPTPPY